jgi:hypothetical protein
MGPIDYLVVEFPGGKLSGEATPILLDLVDRGIVRILDVAFAMKEADGSMRRLNIRDLPGPASGLAAFEGASSDLLSPDDLDAVGAIVEPGSGVGVLVYENSWAASLGMALRRGGAQLVSNGRIPVQAMLAALEKTDAAA